MDPLSLVVSVTGLVTAAAKITSVLSDFIAKEKDAPNSARSIVAEVNHLRVCLTQLFPFLDGTGVATRTRRAAVSLESVVIISTSCVMTLSDLERLLDTFRLDQPFSRMMKIRWALQEQKVLTLVSRVREARNSLNLIITILTWSV